MLDRRRFLRQQSNVRDPQARGLTEQTRCALLCRTAVVQNLRSSSTSGHSIALAQNQLYCALNNFGAVSRQRLQNGVDSCVLAAAHLSLQAPSPVHAEWLPPWPFVYGAQQPLQPT